MKPISWAGLILIVLGVVVLIFGGITYNKKKDVMDLGSVHVTATHQKHIDFPPIVGGLIVIGGIVLMVAGSRQRS